MLFPVSPSHVKQLQKNDTQTLEVSVVSFPSFWNFQVQNQHWVGNNLGEISVLGLALTWRVWGVLRLSFPQGHCWWLEPLRRSSAHECCFVVCYGLNVCIPPSSKIHMLKSYYNPWCRVLGGPLGADWSWG